MGEGRSRATASRGHARRHAVAAGYEEILTRFVQWAENRSDIHAAVVVGSRARKDHPADEWADMDLALFCAQPNRYADDATWVDALGVPWITFLEPTAVGGAQERRVLFEGGLDVDVALFPAERLARMAVGGMPPEFADAVRRGVRILIDREGIFAAASVHVPPRTPRRPPTEAEVLNAVNDFWYHAVWCAKHLRRGELWWAKSGCDEHMKETLRAMLEWHAQAAHGAGWDTWMRGRFLEEWADPKVVRQLRAAFAHYEPRDVWRALRSTMQVFRGLSRKTLTELGYPYPEESDRRATEWVERLAPGRARRRSRAAARRPHL